jgi:hypothetical protein
MGQEAHDLIPCGGGRLAFRSGKQIYVVDEF